MASGFGSQNQITSLIARWYEVFYSYVGADEDLRGELDKHLSLLRHEGLITAFHKRQITAGGEWKNTLDQHLHTASVQHRKRKIRNEEEIESSLHIQDLMLPGWQECHLQSQRPPNLLSAVVSLFSLVCFLECLNIKFLHLKERFCYTISLLLITTLQHFVHDSRNNLPGNTIFILQPTTLLCFRNS